MNNMAGSTSSISSNEGRAIKPVVTGRGYNLTSTSTAPTPGGSQSSRTQTPPPAITQANNTSATNSPTASSRNALGITHGWGVGMAHSGSYLGKFDVLQFMSSKLSSKHPNSLQHKYLHGSSDTATNVRTTSTIPLLVEDPETYDAIRNIMIRKKTREQSQLEMRAKQQAAKMKRLPTAEEQEENVKKREAAVLQFEQGKERLSQLLAQRDELTKSIREEWDEKIEKHENESLLKEEEAITALKVKHEEEIKQLIDDVEKQNKADEEELALKLSEMDKAIEEKREPEPAPASDGVSALSTPPKKQKIEEQSQDNAAADGKEPNDLYDDLFESPVKPFHKEEAEESDHELFGDSDNEAEKSPGDQKKDELKVRLTLPIIICHDVIVSVD
jgi:hypothetical protein